ncbi:LysM and putative peptidoglycan-binding domain-containing protein 1 [Collichthys lucidus]|uniref:LysM and putative peptidoglycan-binding domain-containing protein 1 n=1 Tax=Collichthys lucidus TaxID=240159 RepID=A0A4U5V4A6_COLLU|nr:LysM and putative peptidoglycan-binding domain-containing protein 1 [Collichthys lucidus]
MSGERAPLPTVGNGLLRGGGGRTRSYGSLVRSPVHQRRIEHKIQPGETLPGLALKYGVSMEQIKRANRMYTNDSIFLKKSLSIPVLSDLEHGSNGVSKDSEEDSASAQNGPDRASDLTPEDFLKRLDGLISQSKNAAVKGCQEAEKRVAALEAACAGRTSDWRPLTRSQSVVSSPRMLLLQQQAPHGTVPLTITKLTKKLRDREDEIFSCDMLFLLSHSDH